VKADKLAVIYVLFEYPLLPSQSAPILVLISPPKFASELEITQIFSIDFICVSPVVDIFVSPLVLIIRSSPILNLTSSPSLTVRLVPLIIQLVPFLLFLLFQH
jgi:hypothetical protein